MCLCPWHAEGLRDLRIELMLESGTTPPLENCRGAEGLAMGSPLKWGLGQARSPCTSWHVGAFLLLL